MAYWRGYNCPTRCKLALWTAHLNGQKKSRIGLTIRDIGRVRSARLIQWVHFLEASPQLTLLYGRISRNHQCAIYTTLKEFLICQLKGFISIFFSSFTKSQVPYICLILFGSNGNHM